MDGSSTLGFERIAEQWEERYSSSDSVWSGRAHPILSDVAEMLPPGDALDVGSGEGADVLWLAARGWSATGLDLSPTATARATQAAGENGLSSATFATGNLLAWKEKDSPLYDLVTGFYLHVPDDNLRAQLLSAAFHRVAPGGLLLVVSHGPRVPGSSRGPEPVDPNRDLDLLDPGGGAEVLELGWRARGARLRPDAVLLLRRLAD